MAETADDAHSRRCAAQSANSANQYISGSAAAWPQRLTPVTFRRSTLREPGSRVADQVDRDGGRSLRRGAGVVHHVVDGADAAEGDGQDVVQLDPRCHRDLEATCRVDRRVDVEEAVATQAPPFVR